MDASEDLSPWRYLDLSIIGFKIGGLWVGQYERNWMNWLQTFQKYFIIIFVFILPILGQTLYIAYVAKNEEIIWSVNILLMEILTAAKICNFMYHRNSFVELISHLKSDFFRPSEAEHLEIIRDRIWLSRIVVKVFYVVCPFAIIGFCLAPILNGEHRIPTNIDYLVFDINKSPNYEIVYFFHMIYKSTAIIIFVAIQTTPQALMSFIVAQLEMLIFNLENMSMLIKRKQIDTGYSADQVATDIMRNCVDRHKSILSFTRKLESIFSLQFFLQYFIISLVICTLGVAIMTIHSLKDSIAELLWIPLYLIHSFTDLYITCVFGNTVTTKSEYLSTAAYQSGWYARSAPFKRSVLVFMTYTHCPLVIRAANFFSVSILTYTTMISWTYKAFALINQTTNK